MTFDFDKVQDLMDDDLPITANLSAGGASLALTALYLMADRWRWPSISDNDWDTIQAQTAQLERELMKNALIGHVVAIVTEPTGSQLLCDGATYDRIDYPELYAVLESEWIDDADTFHVPDIIGRFVVGAGGFYDEGDTGGLDTVTLSTGELPEHDHSESDFVSNIDVEGPGVPDPLAIGLPKVPFARTGKTGGGQAHENRPPYLALVYVIIAS